VISRTARAALGTLTKLRAYAEHSAHLAVERPECFRVGDLVRHFPRWWSSLEEGNEVDDLPWLCFSAIDLLEGYLTREMSVFEYGSGGSTLFFSRRVSRVWSVEHDPVWHSEVVKRLHRRGITNCDVRLIPPESRDDGRESDPSDPAEYGSDDARFRRVSFDQYVNCIAEHPDRSLDLVLVDGRARPSCCRAAMSKVKAGGYLVLDNAERGYYHRARELFAPATWALTDIYGPLPGVRHFSETCLWWRIE
jgi:hypothetical protein